MIYRKKMSEFQYHFIMSRLGYSKYNGAYTKWLKKGSRFHCHYKGGYLQMHIDYTNKKTNKHYVAPHCVLGKEEYRAIKEAHSLFKVKEPKPSKKKKAKRNVFAPNLSELQKHKSPPPKRSLWQRLKVWKTRKHIKIKRYTKRVLKS